ncbi:MAG TPA: hypothetical protein VIK71_08500 [Flavobacteriales bacterium]
MMLTLKSETDLQTIRQFKYHDTDVLDKPQDRIKRASSLMKAALLDTMSGSEAIVIIQSVNEVNKVRSRVIAVGNERVMLERGVSIPLGSIRDVEFP